MGLELEMLSNCHTIPVSHLTQWITDIQRDVLGFDPPLQYDYQIKHFDKAQCSADQDYPLDDLDQQYSTELDEMVDQFPMDWEMAAKLSSAAPTFSRHNSLEYPLTLPSKPPSTSRQSSYESTSYSRVQATAMGDLHWNLIEKILSQLDLVSLCRVRRVCRTWADMAAKLIKRQTRVLSLGGHRSVVWDSTSPLGNRCPDPTHLLMPFGNIPDYFFSEYEAENKIKWKYTSKAGVISPTNVTRIFHIPADPVTRCFQISLENGYSSLFSILTAASDLRAIYLSYMTLEARLFISIANNCPQLEHIEIINCHGHPKALQEGWAALGRHCGKLVHCRIQSTDIPLGCLLRSGIKWQSLALYCCNMDGSQLALGLTRSNGTNFANQSHPDECCKTLTHLALDGCPKIRQSHLIAILNSDSCKLNHLSLHSMEIRQDFVSQLNATARRRLIGLELNVSVGFDSLPDRLGLLSGIKSLSLNSFSLRPDVDSVLTPLFRAAHCLPYLTSLCLHNTASPALVALLPEICPALLNLDLSTVYRPNGTGPPAGLFVPGSRDCDTTKGITGLKQLKRLDISGTMANSEQIMSILDLSGLTVRKLLISKCKKIDSASLIDYLLVKYDSISNGLRASRTSLELTARDTPLSRELTAELRRAFQKSNLKLKT